MIKAIIFDFFGVLYVQVGEDFYRSHIPNYQAQRDELRDLGKQADYGLITQAQLVARIAELGQLDPETVQRDLVGHWIRNRAMLDFVAELHGSYKTGLLTNMVSGAMHKFFTQAELEKYFNSVVISGEVGTIKPGLAAYELAASKLGVNVDECLLIDDSPMNCRGAEDAGMQAILYESTHQTMQAVRRLLQ